MQFQSDIINAPVHRPECVETTAMGAAYLAGLAAKFWKDIDDIKKNRKIDKEFLPNMSEEERCKELKGWNQAVKATFGWAE